MPIIALTAAYWGLAGRSALADSLPRLSSVLGPGAPFCDDGRLNFYRSERFIQRGFWVTCPRCL
jgi:hypothetical protein